MNLPAVAFATMLLILPAARAQDAAFTAAVDRNPVGLGEQFTLTFTVSSAGQAGPKNLQPPDLSKFRLLSGPNTSTSMQFVNGQFSSSVTYSYILQATEAGKFTIGPASVEASGRVLTTAPFIMEVSKTPPKPKQQAGGGDAGMNLGDDLFVRASVDRSRVTQGQQLNLTYRLYTRVNVLSYAIGKNPAMTGFWSEEIENPKNIELATETIEGKQYRVGVIRRMALFPTQSGTLEISPLEVQTTLQVRSRSADPFDAFFRDPFGREVQYAVRTEPVKVKVDPLPPGAPPGFKGAVGSFTMTAGVDRPDAKTNEPVSYKVRIAGTGNVKLLEAPVLDLPKDFEQYTPKVSETISREKGKVSGSKTFEYLLIPRYPGKRTIKPVSFSYYNLEAGEYRTLTSPAIQLNVVQGAAGPSPLVAGGVQSGVELLNQDIRFIKLSTGPLRPRSDSFPGLPAALMMGVLPLAAVVGAFVYARRRRAVLLDEAGFRNRRALRVARSGLRRASELLKKGSEAVAPPASRAEFYAEVSRALWKYLGDKLGIPPSGLSIDGTAEELGRRSVPPETIAAVRSLLESCEMARFAPAGLDPAGMKRTYDDATRIIVAIEKGLAG
jgi:hypothetical protein